MHAINLRYLKQKKRAHFKKNAHFAHVHIFRIIFKKAKLSKWGENQNCTAKIHARIGGLI